MHSYPPATPHAKAQGVKLERQGHNETTVKKEAGRMLAGSQAKVENFEIASYKYLITAAQ